tara:strand:- start:155 stop:328 length:174 start_codon:yes stop_codon:yes gene_type:complete
MKICVMGGTGNISTNLGLDCKKTGRAKNRTPIIYTVSISRSIYLLNDFLQSEFDTNL